MKLNAFQKILLLIYLLLIFVSCILYVPFNESDEVSYDVIWSNQSNVDLFRIGFYLIIFTALFYLFYKYLNRMNNLDPFVYRKKAKMELKIFTFFIASLILTISFYIGNNLVNYIYGKAYDNKMEEINVLIDEKSEKIKSKEYYRNKYWSYCSKVFNLNEFHNNNENLWQGSMKKREDSVWLKKVFNRIPVMGLKELKINSPKDLRRFFEENNFNDHENELRRQIRKLNAEFTSLKNKNYNLVSFRGEEIIESVVFCFVVLFAILYILRPSIIFIKGIYAELK